MGCLGRRIGSFASPIRAEFKGKYALLLTAREDKDLAGRVQVFRHLEDEVARAAETGQPENLSILQTRELERSVPYAAGAEQRSRFCITENVGNRVSVLLRNDYELGVPAIRVASCRPEVVTQVFCDIAGGRVNPANTHSIADF